MLRFVLCPVFSCFGAFSVDWVGGVLHDFLPLPLLNRAGNMARVLGYPLRRGEVMPCDVAPPSRPPPHSPRRTLVMQGGRESIGRNVLG